MRTSRRKPLAFALMGEAVSAMVQQPSRLVLTALGVAVGVGSLVATIGLASTASAQIGSDFNALLATQVGVGGASGNTQFPADSAKLVEALPGVRSASVWYVVDNGAVMARSQAAMVYSPIPARLVAAGNDYLAADQAWVSGETPSPALASSGGPVADIGAGLARSLGISAHQLPATVYTAGRSLTVIGIISRSPIDPALLTSVVVPAGAAQALWGSEGGSDQEMIIHTDPGAAQVVAAEAPRAIDPEAPRSLVAVAPPNPTTLRDQVQASVSALFLGLAAVAMSIGGLGIANMTLVSVLERTAEIGLRRAIGAKRRHILGQFVLESGLTGLLGGIAGTCFGVLIVEVIAIERTWTVTLPAGLPLLAPAIGLTVGILAGTYPACRASSIETVQALRR
jgi:putative ABC transport system permease protein